MTAPTPAPATTPMTREDWLTEAAYIILDDILAPHHDQPAPPIRISVGFPKGRSSKAIAQCFKRHTSTDQHNEIFVSPLIDSPNDILAALTHELIHALDDCESGHKRFFAIVARKAGLEGKLTATYAGPELATKLQDLINLLPTFPYAKMELSKIPKQTTRMLKAECGECGFTFRLTRTAIAKLTDRRYCLACQNDSMTYPDPAER